MANNIIYNPITAVIFIIVTGYFVVFQWYAVSNNSTVKPTLHSTQHQKTPNCPNVLENMTNGSWKPRTMTNSEKKEMQTFQEHARMEWGLPKNVQRQDLLCANASFAPNPKDPYRFFRALCDPEGTTPCCMNNKCAAETITICNCENCLDLRQRYHAEYSDWVPSNTLCKVNLFKGKEPCMVLDGMTIFLSGDSLMRHMYIAFQLLLNNDMVTGSLQKETSKGNIQRCKGWYSFTEKKCRKYMSTDTSRLCNGRVNVTFGEFYNTNYSPQFIKAVQDLTRKPKSLIIAGIGHHVAFNSQIVQDKYIGPALEIKKKLQKWPKLLWSMPSAQGLLRETKTKSFSKLQKFRNVMTKYLRKLNVPVFDPYGMTDGMVSFDGIHHGMGINIQKVQIILNFIAEMRNKENW